MDESTRCRLSRVLYDALNQQGYSAGRIKYRSKTFSRAFKQLDSKLSNYGHMEGIFAGSFGEGISKMFSSDMDVMTVQSDIICVDERSHTNGPYSLVFQNEYTNTSPRLCQTSRRPCCQKLSDTSAKPNMHSYRKSLSE